MKTLLNKTCKVLFSLLALIISVSISSAAEKAARVAVIPFTVNAEKDLSFLRQGIVDMLSSRLAWEGKVVVISREAVLSAYPAGAGLLTEKDAREIGTALDADYVLFGSMTVFGNSVSIDAKMADISNSRPTLAFFNQSQGMDEVIPRINQFAEEINATIFGRKIAVPALAQQQAQQQAPSIYAHPEKALEPELRQGGLVKEGQSPFVVERGAEGGRDFWKSQNIAEELKGLALADVDGDGKTETVLISSRKVLVYRAEAGRFVKLGEYSGESYKNFIGVDAVDIKKDGRAEIFVTSLDLSAKRLDSFVLEWRDNKLVPSATGLNWYFRAVTHPARGRLLLGQKRGATELFVAGVDELEWNGKAYEAAAPLDLPGGVTVFGFALGDIMKDGREMIIAFNKYDHLRVLTASGQKEWEGKDPVGGSENFLEELTSGSSKDQELDRIYLPQRLLLVDLDQNGRNELVTVRNHALSGRLFDRFRQFDEAQFESLSWDGLGLSRNWHTRKVSGYVCDYAIGDFDNDGRPDLVAALVSKRDPVIGKARSSVIAYDLSPMVGKK
ncbi:MAG: FG-GAP-like repeat-containing protein [Desulfobacterales bacterium]|nr:FG-GAP-like repeat-containing protein [Desulfobacterales bacterium]